MTLHQEIKKQVIQILSLKERDDISGLNDALRLLAKHRSLLIQNTLIQNEGLKVHQGPLSGLDFIKQSSEGCHIAKLLGCYEQPLLPYIEHAINQNYNSIINIGCAEGYYAVGMALRMPKTHFYAFDIDDASQVACLELAKKNLVEDRLDVFSSFCVTDFEKYSHGRNLILCDIEGAEGELLDPATSNFVKEYDYIIELHEFERPGLIEVFKSRFSETHNLKIVIDNGQRDLKGMPNWFFNLSHLDQLLSVWEWRGGPTPWIIMTKK